MAMLPRLKDHTIRFRTAAIPDQTFEANVFSTGSIVNEASRTLPLTAVAENSELALKPGMFVDVELPGDDIGETLSIPSSAVQEHEGQTFVFVHRGDDRFERRDVKVGRKLNETMEIIAGVREGDHIVNEGGFFLKSQMLSEQFADDD
jgi:membrane fusion protein, heavy metal efflux system